jgi:hypothetical protein
VQKRTSARTVEGASDPRMRPVHPLAWPGFNRVRRVLKLWQQRFVR